VAAQRKGRHRVRPLQGRQSLRFAATGRECSGRAKLCFTGRTILVVAQYYVINGKGAFAGEEESCRGISFRRESPLTGGRGVK